MSGEPEDAERGPGAAAEANAGPAGAPAAPPAAAQESTAEEDHISLNSDAGAPAAAPAAAEGRKGDSASPRRPSRSPRGSPAPRRRSRASASPKRSRSPPPASTKRRDRSRSRSRCRGKPSAGSPRRRGRSRSRSRDGQLGSRSAPLQSRFRRCRSGSSPPRRRRTPPRRRSRSRDQRRQFFRLGDPRGGPPLPPPGLLMRGPPPPLGPKDGDPALLMRWNPGYPWWQFSPWQCDWLPGGHTRFFVVRSQHPESAQQSLESGKWAASTATERVLMEAFQASRHVVLICAVKDTQHFQGYCTMRRKIPRRDKEAQRKEPGPPFEVTWHRWGPVSYEQLEIDGVTNSLNQKQPLRRSRDGQELPFAAGVYLCRCIDYCAYKCGSLRALEFPCSALEAGRCEMVAPAGSRPPPGFGDRRRRRSRSAEQRRRRDSSPGSRSRREPTAGRKRGRRASSGSRGQRGGSGSREEQPGAKRPYRSHGITEETVRDTRPQRTVVAPSKALSDREKLDRAFGRVPAASLVDPMGQALNALLQDPQGMTQAVGGLLALLGAPQEPAPAPAPPPVPDGDVDLSGMSYEEYVARVLQASGEGRQLLEALQQPTGGGSA